MSKENEHYRDGHQYTAMEFPQYRKIGETSLFKVMENGYFVNVLYKSTGEIGEGTYMISKSRMNVITVTNFFYQSKESNATEFDGYFKHVQQHILKDGE